MEILYQLKFCDKRNGIPVCLSDSAGSDKRNGIPVCLSDSAGMGSEPGGIFLSPWTRKHSLLSIWLVYMLFFFLMSNATDK